MNWQTPFAAELNNSGCQLRLMRQEDRAALEELVFKPGIWDHFVTRVDTPVDLDTLIRTALDDIAAGRRAVYVVIDKRSGHIAGSMCYGNMAPADRRLEIGWSWLAPQFHGSGLNGWAKHALLEQAFEHMGAERVEFKTDVLNLRARQALRKIGATEEGVLRSFNYMPGGRRRDAIYYSVLRSEWPSVSARLNETLREPA
ncbi:RimJ/RimL family protein N-acetyltransferase [Undibacterium sp. GrIS 1.2]